VAALSQEGQGRVLQEEIDLGLELADHIPFSANCRFSPVEMPGRGRHTAHRL